MQIYEINICGEVYVSLSEPLAEHIETQILEANLYGKNLFLKNDDFYHFTLDGPKKVEKENVCCRILTLSVYWILQFLRLRKTTVKILWRSGCIESGKTLQEEGEMLC